MTDVFPKPAAAVRVLHTADWHLGKMLGDLDRADEHQRFLDWLLGELARQQVDLLLISGDIFDTANPPQAAERQYFEFLAGVYRETKCAVIVTGGNHDSPAHLEAPRRVLHTLNVHITGALPGNIEDLLVPFPSIDDPQLLVAAVPFLRDRDLRTGAFGQTADDIRDELRRGVESVYRRAADACAGFRKQGAALIAMGHLTVAGARVSESERVVHVGGLGKVDHKVFPEDFCYVALGHLHRPQSMGADTIRYSGSPIPLSFSECEDVKEVRVLDVHHGELIANHTLPIPATRYLAQVKVTRPELEQTLAHLAPARGALPSWVEVSVETADASENLFELVQKLTEHRRDDFEIVRVQARRERSSGALLSESEDDQFRSVDALLDDPVEVFERRLEMLTDLSVSDAAEMRVAFRELYQIHLDSEGGSAAKPLPPEKATESKVVVPEIAEELHFDFFDAGGEPK
ncbi:MAG: exonuclease subunit SbcD [Verrucomicrobiales bacterium]